MGQQSIATMNPATSGKSSTRSSGYHQKALAEIRNSLLPFATGGVGENGSSAASTISTLSTTSGVSSASGLSGLSAASGSNGVEKDLNVLRQSLSQLIAMGYTEDLDFKTFAFLHAIEARVVCAPWYCWNVDPGPNMEDGTACERRMSHPIVSKWNARQIVISR